MSRCSKSAPSATRCPRSSAASRTSSWRTRTCCATTRRSSWSANRAWSSSARSSGFKGYPDLKLSVGEEIARRMAATAALRRRRQADPHAALAESLWRAKAKAEEETRLDQCAGQDRRDHVADWRGKVFLIGLGEDTCQRRRSLRNYRIGIVAMYHADPVLMSSEHLDRSGEGRAAGVFGAGQAADAVPDLPPIPRTSRQGDLDYASHCKSAARPFGCRC